MNALTRTQLGLIREIRSALGAAGIHWWLFGGWGLDARIGYVTRDHHDIEFWVFHEDADSTREALMACGFEAPESLRPEESQEFLKDGVNASSAFLRRNQDGSVGVRGRWSDWQFPPDAFQQPPGRIDGLVVPAMSVEGMLAMKVQFPALRHGRPLRDKDAEDIGVLRKLLEATDLATTSDADGESPTG